MAVLWPNICHLLLRGFFNKPRMSQYPCINQMVMVWKLLISMSHGPKGSTNSKPALQVTEGNFYFLFIFFSFSLVTVGFGSSSINSTTNTGSSAGVNFTHCYKSSRCLSRWEFSWYLGYTHFASDGLSTSVTLKMMLCFFPCFPC